MIPLLNDLETAKLALNWDNKPVEHNARFVVEMAVAVFIYTFH